MEGLQIIDTSTSEEVQIESNPRFEMKLIDNPNGTTKYSMLLDRHPFIIRGSKMAGFDKWASTIWFTTSPSHRISIENKQKSYRILSFFDAIGNQLQEKGFGEEYLPWFRPNQKHETNVSLFYPEKLDFRDGKGVQYEITSDNISIVLQNIGSKNTGKQTKLSFIDMFEGTLDIHRPRSKTGLGFRFVITLSKLYMYVKPELAPVPKSYSIQLPTEQSYTDDFCNGRACGRGSCTLDYDECQVESFRLLGD